MTWLRMVRTERKKVWSCNKFKKWSAGVTNEFSSETSPDTLKEIVQFVHEVHPVFVVTQDVRSSNKLWKIKKGAMLVN